MEKERIIAALPSETGNDPLSWALSELMDSDLGGDRLVFCRESVEIEAELLRTMTEIEWDEWEERRKRKWGAGCVCSECGEEFILGYKNNGARVGVTMAVGEDGQGYTGWVDEESEESPGENMTFYEGDEIFCPMCGKSLYVTNKATIGNGQTYAVMVSELQIIEGQAAIIYHLIRMRLNPWGRYSLGAEPVMATVLNEKTPERYLRCYFDQYGRFHPSNHWKLSGSTTDPEQLRYYSFDANCHTKIGAAFFPYGPELTGTSGEKTGLAEYLEAGARSPVLYLKLWRKHPNVENLMKIGLSEAVTEDINRQIDQCLEYNTKCGTVDLDWVNWKEVKPNKMLGISKEQLRDLLSCKWSYRELKLWKAYCSKVERVEIPQYDIWLRHIGVIRLERLEDLQIPLSRIMKYLEKQPVATVPEAAELYADYIQMLRRIVTAPTHEELFPRNILTAHDIMAQLATSKGFGKNQAGFDNILKSYGAAEWSDGVLCARLPRNNKELIDEGRILRHCVGGYGENHISGSLIVFIRHARRPERSYYTLNVSVKGLEIRRIQLHGYGNERHGENKEHSHKIPQQVLDFCDRWEREILTPVHKQVLAEKREKLEMERKGTGDNNKKGKNAA